MTEKERFFGMSPLPLEEKRAIMEKEYFPKIYRYGYLTDAIALIVNILPPVLLAVTYGAWAPVEVYTGAFFLIMSFSGPFWIIEPVAYFTILGVAGTFLSFMAGNISTMRLPCSAVAQEVVGIREGSEEGEVISNIAICASQWINMAIVTITAIGGVVLIGYLPPFVKMAFIRFCVPGIIGGTFVQFLIRSPRYGLLALVLGFIAAYFGVASMYKIPVIVAFMMFLGWYMYKRKLKQREGE